MNKEQPIHLFMTIYYCCFYIVIFLEKSQKCSWYTFGVIISVCVCHGFNVLNFKSCMMQTGGSSTQVFRDVLKFLCGMSFKKSGRMLSNMAPLFLFLLKAQVMLLQYKVVSASGVVVVFPAQVLVYTQPKLYCSYFWKPFSVVLS